MMKKSGYADLPLHYGKVPIWLYERMTKLGEAVLETIIIQYGKAEVLRRISDPFWFQALGCAMGMDWHSSGITTSVMGSLKKATARLAPEYGLFICGGRGKHSLKTPEELLLIADKTGLDGNRLVNASRLSAKIDNTAVQDGYQLYLHSFILTTEGDWAVVQQGMNEKNKMARRYHWHSPSLQSFVEEPHACVCGVNQGLILNLTDMGAAPARSGILSLFHQKNEVLTEVKKFVMPNRHDVRATDVDLKKLGAILALSDNRDIRDFESVLLLKGVGPRALQSLTLVSEIIHGSPSRFRDPARFTFAHGGKDGHPFPVPVKVYDETISILKSAVERSKLGFHEKQKAIESLHRMAAHIEKDFVTNDRFEDLLKQERENSWKYGGRTVYKKEQPPKKSTGAAQLELFKDYHSLKDQRS